MLLAIIQNYDRKYAEAEALLKEGLAIGPLAKTSRSSSSSSGAPT